MPRRPQNYHRPQSLTEALELLNLPDAAPLAGGTRLLAGDIEADNIVDLQDLALSGINFRGNELLIGATTRLIDIEQSAEIRGDAADLLRRAVHASGPNTFRNAATLGGVIASREPNSELLAVLHLHVVRIYYIRELQDIEQPQMLRLYEYLSQEPDPRRLITLIQIPWDQGHGALERVSRTPADEPIVAVAGWRSENGRLALSAVGIDQVPIRLFAAEQAKTLEERIIAAQNAVNHPGDFRGSTEYRREMVAVLLRRVLAAIG